MTPPIDRFELAIDPPQQGVYPVHVTTAAGEQATGTLTLPQGDADWEAMLAELAYRDRTTICSAHSATSSWTHSSN